MPKFDDPYMLRLSVRWCGEPPGHWPVANVCGSGGVAVSQFAFNSQAQGVRLQLPGSAGASKVAPQLPQLGSGSLKLCTATLPVFALHGQAHPQTCFCINVSALSCQAQLSLLAQGGGRARLSPLMASTVASRGIQCCPRQGSARNVEFCGVVPFNWATPATSISNYGQLRAQDHQRKLEP